MTLGRVHLDLGECILTRGRMRPQGKGDSLTGQDALPRVEMHSPAGQDALPRVKMHSPQGQDALPPESICILPWAEMHSPGSRRTRAELQGDRGFAAECWGAAGGLPERIFFSKRRKIQKSKNKNKKNTMTNQRLCGFTWKSIEIPSKIPRDSIDTP